MRSMMRRADRERGQAADVHRAREEAELSLGERELGDQKRREDADRVSDDGAERLNESGCEDQEQRSFHAGGPPGSFAG